MSPAARSHRLLDRFGAAGSLACAVHCALLPLAIALLPALGIGNWLGEGFERGFVAFATLLGFASVYWGYRKHGAVRALGLLAAGLTILWSAILYPPLHEHLVAHALVMTCGGTLVGLAHLANLRLVHIHDASCAH
ncbi:membrane protein [Lysobacter helvus]|uniref:Membrane protein n=2 Tax=Lysobacteraceae TaxID=32033 RepID=A0ABM7Q2H4_9GAMM|nr:MULTISPECIES: MerC domain-containing protein [Lysobacter]BCT91415.1 membrane protein [Lysobacter caseinilyticus]BCT94568.1 membrane protein [Lysobacter helvus]